MENQRIRILYSKLGDLRYIGALDMIRLWERTFRRARLQVAYSQGFHPQPRFHIGCPLPLGIGSTAELLDVWLTNAPEMPQLQEIINHAAPSGIRVLTCQEVSTKLPPLQVCVLAADYSAQFTDADIAPALQEKIAQTLDTPSLPRTWRGKAYDLRPLIEHLSLAEDGEKRPILRMRLAAREGATGRPEEVLAVLGIAPNSIDITRTQLFFKPD